MHHSCADMMRLFEGWHLNYGTYKLTGEVTPAGKALGKAYSKKGEVTVEMWHDHLMGVQGLGIIPITDKSLVKFAAIDIDEYPLSLAALASNIKDNKLPLVVCRTKSGGAHLYLFLNDWAPAKMVQAKMRELAAFLGYGACEIFPKQVQILAERGDVGQWINMPYFNAGDTERYAVDDFGKKLQIDQFIRFAALRAIDPERFAIANYSVTKGNDPLPDGPPCLNYLSSKGFPPGTRNNGLFNLGIYAQKVNPDNWETTLGEFNTRFMDPPLSPSEVGGVVKSLKKSKGYNYTCKQQPIIAHCNLSKCRACKFGVGVMGVGMPKYGTLCKIATNPPVWFVDVEGGGRIELSTDQLQYIHRYQTRCIEELNILPPLVKGEIWNEILAKLLDDVTVVEVPAESTPKGLLYQYLEEFCTSRVQGKTHDELLLGKPWTSNKLVYFRIRDFMGYLERMKFKAFGMHHIATYLKEWGAEKHFFNVKGKGVNCYSIPEFKKIEGEFNVPQEVNKKPEVV
jgi:hypothetical protein